MLFRVLHSYISAYINIYLLIENFRDYHHQRFGIWSTNVVARNRTRYIDYSVMVSSFFFNVVIFVLFCVFLCIFVFYEWWWGMNGPKKSFTDMFYPINLKLNFYFAMFTIKYIISMILWILTVFCFLCIRNHRSASTQIGVNSVIYIVLISTETGH